MVKKSGQPVIIDTVQVALFPNDFKIQNASELQAELLSKGFIRSSGKLKINTFPEGFPPEIVRIEAQLKEFDMDIKIAPAKISLYWSNEKGDEDFAINLEQIFTVLAKIKELILKEKTLKRVGFITNIYKKITNPETLIKKALTFKNKSEIWDGKLVLTYNWKLEKVEWKDIRFNKHVIIGIGLVKKADRAIAIQYDLNTHQENRLQWRLPDVQSFIREASKISSKPNKIYSEFF